MTKKQLFILLLLALASGCNQHSMRSRPPTPLTFSSFDPPGAMNAVPAHIMRFVDADLAQILALYQELSSRSIIRSPMVSPNVKISFENSTAMTRTEALQALDNVPAAQNIVMVYLGTRYVKAVPAGQAPQEAAPIMEMPWQDLPESSSFVTVSVPLKHLAPEQASSILQPFARLPNSIIGVKGSDVISPRLFRQRAPDDASAGKRGQKWNELLVVSGKEIAFGRGRRAARAFGEHHLMCQHPPDR